MAARSRKDEVLLINRRLVCSQTVVKVTSPNWTYDTVNAPLLKQAGRLAVSSTSSLTNPEFGKHIPHRQNSTILSCAWHTKRMDLESSSAANRPEDTMDPICTILKSEQRFIRAHSYRQWPTEMCNDWWNMAQSSKCTQPERSEIGCRKTEGKTSPVEDGDIKCISLPFQCDYTLVTTTSLIKSSNTEMLNLVAGTGRGILSGSIAGFWRPCWQANAMIITVRLPHEAHLQSIQWNALKLNWFEGWRHISSDSGVTPTILNS